MAEQEQTAVLEAPQTEAVTEPQTEQAAGTDGAAGEATTGARIPLYRDDSVIGYAVVDHSDFPFLSQWRWRVAEPVPGYRYARRYENRKPVLMHRLLVDAEGMEVDHINGDTLDNRRVNLRAVSHAQNLQNITRTRGRSKYRGVVYAADRARWRAHAFQGAKHIHIGYFATEEEAAHAASQWRTEHMPYAANSGVGSGIQG